MKIILERINWIKYLSIAISVFLFFEQGAKYVQEKLNDVPSEIGGVRENIKHVVLDPKQFVLKEIQNGVWPE